VGESTEGRKETHAKGTEVQNTATAPEINDVDLAEQLYNFGAEAGLPAVAAVQILLNLPYAVFARDDFRAAYQYGTDADGVVFVTVHWDELVDLPLLSTGEKAALQIAASIARASHTVALGECLSRIDYETRATVLDALRLVAGMQ
jgi:hypothetical protein